MSGGSFNYVCYKLLDLEEPAFLSDLREMRDYLIAYGKPQAAKPIADLIEQFESAYKLLRAESFLLYSTTKAVEWWASFDWGYEKVEKELEWLATKRNSMVE